MNFKRILSLVTTGTLLFGCAASFTGCKKTPTVEKRVLENSYRVTTLDKPESLDYADYMFVSGDRIYLRYYNYDRETYEGRYLTCSVAMDGTDLKEENIPALSDETTTEENVSLYTQTVTPAGDGTFWKVIYRYEYDPETWEGETEYFLRHVEADNTEIASIKGSDLWGNTDEDEENYVYHSMSRLTAVGDGVVVIDNDTMYSISGNGEILARIDISTLTSGSGYVQKLMIVDGEPMLLYSDYSSAITEYLLVRVDMTAGTLGEQQKLDSDVFRNVWSFHSGDGYTFYYNDDDALYGYDAQSGESTCLMNFINSDITSGAFSQVVIVSPDLIICNGYDEVMGDYQLMKLERIPEEEMVPKYILTVATMDPWSISSEVIRFNRQSDEYRFVIKSYSPDDYYVDTTVDYDYEALCKAALDALNSDILMGSIPDVLVVDSSMDLNSYISKGVFADLYTYIDNDERFSREDFLTNILDAYAVNGKLYEITPRFQVRALVGKESLVGNRTGWTMAEFLSWTKTIPEGSEVFFDMTRDEMLEMFCTYAYEDFVDPDTGKCSFDSEDFKQILEYVSTLPTTTFWEQMEDEWDEELYEKYRNRFREDYSILENMYLNAFTTIPSQMNNTFYTNENLVLAGLPSADRSGGTIYSPLTYALSSSTLVPEGAWAFISYFLTEDYQDDLSYYFPIRVSSLEKMADSAVEQAQEQKNQYYAEDDDSGFIVEETIAETVDIAVEVESNEDTFERVFLDREMADSIIAYLKSVTRVYRNNTAVNNIIKEEAAVYFAGDKSLEETVKLIQNRVSTYVAEIR